MSHYFLWWRRRRLALSFSATRFIFSHACSFRFGRSLPQPNKYRLANEKWRNTFTNTEIEFTVDECVTILWKMSQQTFSNHFKFILSIGKKAFSLLRDSIHWANNKYILCYALCANRPQLCQILVVKATTEGDMSNEKSCSTRTMGTTHKQTHIHALKIEERGREKNTRRWKNWNNRKSDDALHIFLCYSYLFASGFCEATKICALTHEPSESTRTNGTR